MQVRFAKRLMTLRTNEPSPHDYSLNEVFRQDLYNKGTAEEQQALRKFSSQWRYNYDTDMPFFDVYFSDVEFRTSLTSKHVLDFGCFTGGRGVRWAHAYQIGKLYGTDINPIYIRAASEFAADNGVSSDYRLLGEDGRIPFPEASIDTVVTFDVLEHVDDLERTMGELIRVLKPRGKMFVVFPSFYNPLESHLDLVTRTPALQWLFSPRTLTTAYLEIIRERGQSAEWYAPTELAGWEKLPTLNGTTIRVFNAYFANYR